MNQSRVDRVASAVLAAMPDRVAEMTYIEPSLKPGEVLLNACTGEFLHVRWVDRDENLVGFAPRPNVG